MDKVTLYGRANRSEDYVGKRMIEMAIPGKRKRGRPKKKWF